MRADATRNRLLIVMVKRPVAGRVKTRLARAIGTVAATGFYRTTLRAVVGRLARDPRWRTILAVDPDAAVQDRGLPPHITRIGQGRGDLGVRMSRLLAVDGLARRSPRHGRRRGFRATDVVVIGSDIPGIVSGHVWSAFRALRGADAVLGPAVDGGYWLIGARGPARHRIVLDAVRWSSPYALADTTAALARCRIPAHRIAHASTLGDVDDGEEWRRLRVRAARRVPHAQEQEFRSSKGQLG